MAETRLNVSSINLRTKTIEEIDEIIIHRMKEIMVDTAGIDPAIALDQAAMEVRDEIQRQISSAA